MRPFICGSIRLFPLLPPLPFTLVLLFADYFPCSVLISNVLFLTYFASGFLFIVFFVCTGWSRLVYMCLFVCSFRPFLSTKSNHQQAASFSSPLERWPQNRAPARERSAFVMELWAGNGAKGATTQSAGGCGEQPR